MTVSAACDEFLGKPQIPWHGMKFYMQRKPGAPADVYMMGSNFCGGGDEPPRTARIHLGMGRISVSMQLSNSYAFFSIWMQIYGMSVFAAVNECSCKTDVTVEIFLSHLMSLDYSKVQFKFET